MQINDPRSLPMLAGFYIVMAPILLIQAAAHIRKFDLALALWFSRRKDMQRAISEEWPGERLVSFWKIYRKNTSKQLDELLSADFERHKQIVRDERSFAFHAECFWVVYD